MPYRAKTSFLHHGEISHKEHLVCFNALSGEDFISTHDRVYKNNRNRYVSMPYRAKTSFLLQRTNDKIDKAAECFNALSGEDFISTTDEEGNPIVKATEFQCPIGRRLHFYVSGKKIQDKISTSFNALSGEDFISTCG